MDLKQILSNHDNDERYAEQLLARLSEVSLLLYHNDEWDVEFVKRVPAFHNDHFGSRSPLSFAGLPELPKLELKYYWSRFLSDERNNSRSTVERRRLPMTWLNSEWDVIANMFGVSCLANIPHPDFPIASLKTVHAEKTSHNKDLLNLFNDYDANSKRKKQRQRYVKNSEIVEKKYWSPRVSIVGDFHKQIIIQREQFKPIHQRMVVYLNDLYDEDDYRFKDVQRTSDSYINFYRYPAWLRTAVRLHVIQKIQHGELAPSTLTGYVGRFTSFRDFMHEKFENPTSNCISDILIEDDFLAWGNKKGLTGKNWFTDTVAMLQTAAREYPDQWPSLSVSKRAAKKVKNVHYQGGLGRIGHNKESAGRSYSQRIINELNLALQDAPYPVLQIFTLILATGVRAEDGHAILFDCLQPDPHDEKFMVLHFWQNKVRKWNRKPLSKSDEAHAALIKVIEVQKEIVLKKHGAPTKYLFPYVTGTRESFVSQGWTLQEIKKKAIENGIKKDDDNPLSFSWHSLRHTMGTSLAENGHDILNIMMELGHTSPDMATVYVNNRLELKKKALIEKGGGRFFTIHGGVDDKIGELLVRKEQLAATRVCGGACAMPAQIGDWCEHANACYTCKYFRADEQDVAFFKAERVAIDATMQEQKEEVVNLVDLGRTRLSEITSRRLEKNKEVFGSLGNIISAIEENGSYQGKESKAKKITLESKK